MFRTVQGRNIFKKQTEIASEAPDSCHILPLTIAAPLIYNVFQKFSDTKEEKNACVRTDG